MINDFFMEKVGAISIHPFACHRINVCIYVADNREEKASVVMAL